jgi:hypothetical protein
MLALSMNELLQSESGVLVAFGLLVVAIFVANKLLEAFSGYRRLFGALPRERALLENAKLRCEISAICRQNDLSVPELASSTTPKTHSNASPQRPSSSAMLLVVLLASFPAPALVFTLVTVTEGYKPALVLAALVYIVTLVGLEREVPANMKGFRDAVVQGLILSYIPAIVGMAGLFF